jgi:hypothetical protein
MFFPIHLADALGYYSQEEVDLVIDETGSAPKSMQALPGGSVVLLVRDAGYVALVSPVHVGGSGKLQTCMARLLGSRPRL